jgi:hypothetical protein
MTRNALNFIQMLNSTHNLLNWIINVLRNFHVLLIRCCAKEYFCELRKYFIIDLCKEGKLKCLRKLPTSNLQSVVELSERSVL